VTEGLEELYVKGGLRMNFAKEKVYHK